MFFKEVPIFIFLRFCLNLYRLGDLLNGKCFVEYRQVNEKLFLRITMFSGLKGYAHWILKKRKKPVQKDHTEYKTVDNTQEKPLYCHSNKNKKKAVL